MNTQVATVEPMESKSPAPITPMEMLQMAVERGADLDKLTKLMDLQERWEANEARKAFTAARAAFKAEAPKISKNKHVKFTSQKGTTEYYHATLDNITNVLGPILSKHGLSYSWETEQLDGGQIKVTCVLTHVLGHSERVNLQASRDETGNKNNIQAVGSAVTYLQRYTLLSITGTATEGQDDDADGATDTINDDQKQTLVDLLKQTGTDTAKFLAFLKVESKTLDELPAKDFDRAKHALEAKRQQAAKK